MGPASPKPRNIPPRIIPRKRITALPVDAGDATNFGRMPGKYTSCTAAARCSYSGAMWQRIGPKRSMKTVRTITTRHGELGDDSGVRQAGPEGATTVVRTITVKHADPLGYGEPRVIDRLRHMAEDAVDKVNEDAVQEEVAILRARLKV